MDHNQDQSSQLLDIDQQIRNCKKCALHATRTHAVPGTGPAQPKFVMIGEGPGEQEDHSGKPFMGPSGDQLNKILQQAGLTRDDVYITNVVKCRTPNNRNPTTEETEACRPWLETQLQIINPKLIVTMGSPATQWFDKTARITKDRGRIRRQPDGRFIIPTFHTAYGLRKPSILPDIQKDFNTVAQMLQILDINPEASNPHSKDINPNTTRAPEDTETIPTLPSPDSKIGPILKITDLMLQSITTLNSHHHPNTNPQYIRHQLNCYSKFMRTLKSHIDTMPVDSQYLNHYVRPRIALAIKHGRTANAHTPHTCQKCFQPFYSQIDKDNQRQDYCAECQ